MTRFLMKLDNFIAALLLPSYRSRATRGTADPKGEATAPGTVRATSGEAMTGGRVKDTSV